MARLTTMSEKISRARELIEEARTVPVPQGLGYRDVNYIVQVKDRMRQARDLIKFISYSPSATPEVKAEVAALFKEIDQAEKEILHK
jgi:hypothetical protein